MREDQLYNEGSSGLKPVYVIYNPFSGNQPYLSKEKIENTLLECGFYPKMIHINQLKPSLIREDIIKQLFAVIVIGGDGTVRLVASYLVKTNVPLAIIPAGTYNHLAKDIRMPDQLEKCLDIILKRKVEKIDIAEVNGHYFLNNSSIGLYRQAVKKTKHSHWDRVIAMTVSLLTTFIKFHTFKVTYLFDGKQVEAVTPLVFISNNLYTLQLFNLSERQTITNGFLYLYINNCASRLKFIGLLINVLLYKQKKTEGFFEIKPVKECDLFLKHDTVYVAIDGDIIKLQTPLHYQIHHRQLTIIKP